MNKSKNNFLLNKRLEILNFAKTLVAKEGLSALTLKNISNVYNLDSEETDILFPEGNNDFIKFTLDQLNDDLYKYCKKIDLIRLPIHKRIRKILLSKIYLMNLDKKFYRHIFLKYLITKNNFNLPKQLYKSVDQIWFIAGDTSTDFNFYTKRLILAGIYIKIILFFFNNNNQNTLENILDKNLKRVSKIPELKSKINIFKDFVPKVFKFVKNSN